LSPQPRRGRASSASHRRSSSKGPAGAPPPPEVENELESEGSVAARHHTATPGVRQRGPAQVRRRTMLRSAFGYVREYIPIFVGFLVLFGLVWAFISFGPHTPTQQQRWTQIEEQWKPKHDADMQRISASVNDFTAQQSAYKALRDDIKGWMSALAEVKDWNDAKQSAVVNDATNASVVQFIEAGNTEVGVLNLVVAAKSADEVLQIGQQIVNAESVFWTDYAIARSDIFSAQVTTSPEPTIALPSGSLSPSGSPGASAAPSPLAESPSPSPSPTPTASAS
jgi:hypothetical protein